MDIDTKVIEHPHASESDEEGRLVIDTEGEGEYIEDTGDPLIGPNNVKVDSEENVPLDLSSTKREAGGKFDLNRDIVCAVVLVIFNYNEK